MNRYKNDAKRIVYDAEALKKARSDFAAVCVAFVKLEMIQDSMRTCPETAPVELKDLARRISQSKVMKASVLTRRYMRLIGSNKMSVEEIPLGRFVDILMTENFDSRENLVEGYFI